MSTFMPGDKVILIDASLTSSLVPIGSDGTVIREHGNGDMYSVAFSNIHNEVMEQIVICHQIVKDLIEAIELKYSCPGYDDKEVI